MSEVRIRREGRAGRITLARPQALNALSRAMLLDIARALAAWTAEAEVRLVLIDAEGPRAFCAGGDIQEIYAAAQEGDFGFVRRFWGEEYRLNAQIAGLRKPVVALVHGFCMGGGVGLACHGSHRVVGESAKMAMPECGIGLVPDVGATTLLEAAPGRLGEFLGLTGHRMGPGDALYAGFADRFVPEAAWPELASKLAQTGDPEEVERLAEPAPESPLAALVDRIDAAFSAPDLAGVSARLAASDWGEGVLETLRRQSPLSMACTLELVRAARAEPGVAAALVREHRFSWRSASEGELLEGIRATVIDKDRRPQWRHALNNPPDPAEIAAMLVPLGPDDLDLPAPLNALRPRSA